MRKRTDKSRYIEFHHSYYIVAIGFLITGHILNLIIFTTLIIIHEFGHFIAAKLMSVKVKKILIYPFGGITKLDTIINLEIEKELLIATSGIIMQFIFYLVICILHSHHLIRNYTMNLYTIYNNNIIFFNLIPIYPLDGSRIITLLLETFLSYKIANILTITLSTILILIIISLNIYTLNYSNIMIYILLLTYIIKLYQNRCILYQRFLIERYLYNYNQYKTKKINNYHYMHKNKKHLIYNGKKYIKEKDFLQIYFQKEHKN